MSKNFTNMLLYVATYNIEFPKIIYFNILRTIFCIGTNFAKPYDYYKKISSQQPILIITRASNSAQRR